MYANVVIDVSSSNVDYEYEYLIPQTLEPIAQPGVRVKVPFGQANRLIMGYIISISEESTYDKEIKEVVEILDVEPVISQEQLQLAFWIKKDTFSPLVRILNLMIPKIMRLKTKKYLLVHDYQALDANLALQFQKSDRIVWDESLKPYTSSIKKAIKANALEVIYDAKSRGKEKKITKYFVNINYFNQNSAYLSSRYFSLLQELIQVNEPLASLDLLELGFTTYLIKKFHQQGFLLAIEETVSRIEKRTLNLVKNEVLKSQSITDTVQQIISAETHVLWSPKSEQEEASVLLQLAQHNLLQKDTFLVICSDILSSYRHASFLSLQTGLPVACLNSDRSDGEIYDYYQEIKNNEYPIIVSTSACVLFPFQNVKMIVLLDTENENYRNDQSPRFHLKYVMKELASITNAKLIFHSVAPDLGTYSESLLKQYKLINSSKDDRFKDPRISIIDMSSELMSGNKLPLARELIKALQYHYQNKKQSLLILNNQGYSQFIICRACGEVIRCPKCEIPMRYYKEPDALVCPTCNQKQTFKNICPKCGSNSIRHIGLGMEKLEEVLHQVLPEARIAIINQSDYQDFEEKMEQILNQEVDIIIASDLFSRSVTQTNITLVGILALDLVANSPLYDAHHRAYALLQHAKLKITNEMGNGELIIQTYNPQHEFLSSFVKDDYFEYFKHELKLREALKVEPNYQVNRILIKGPFGDLFKIGVNIKRTIFHLLNMRVIVIGPAYNKSERAVQLIIKHQSKDIYQIYENLYRTFQDEKINLIFDKYPKTIT